MNKQLTAVYAALKNGGWMPSGGGQKDVFRAICPCCGTRFTGNATKLSVAAGDRVPVLIKCFAGCGAAEVIATLGLSLSELMPPDRTTGRRLGQRWISPAAALAGLCDDAETIAIFAALQAAGNTLSEQQRDELASARARIESTIEQVRFN